jgi:hypothetical protein
VNVPGYLKSVFPLTHLITPEIAELAQCDTAWNIGSNVPSVWPQRPGENEMGLCA